MPRTEKILWVLLALITLALSVAKIDPPSGMNNFLIFRSSFSHLIHFQDLYIEYPSEYFDFYKYGPTFAVLMAPFSFLPAAAGALIWNMCGLLAFAIALCSLDITSRQRQAIALICAPELFGNLQNFQSNTLLVALFVMVFTMLEKKHFVWAGLVLALSVHVKIFGLSMLVLGLLYPGAWRFWVASLCWLMGLAALPLIFVSPEQLVTQYQSWLNLLVWDSNGSHGISFMGAFFGLTGIALPNLPVQAIAGLILVVPLFLVRQRTTPAFRMLALASVLMWMIIFNHKSESPTYVIGMIGFAIWYVLQTTPLKNWALAVTLFFVSVCYSDAVPASFAKNFVSPLEVKVWPLIIIWVWLQWTLFDSLKRKTL